MDRDTICLVEDKKTIRLFYESFLIDKGFDVISFANRPSAQAGIKVENISIFILDIVLEGEVQGGYLLANHIRSVSQSVPIVFLTDRKNEEIPGLSRNVNDFIVKGHTDDYMNRFYARVSNHIRIFKEKDIPTNSLEGTINTTLSIGNLHIDLAKDKVYWRLQLIRLAKLDIKLLFCLAARSGSLLDYNDIRMSIGKPNIETAAIQVHISNIRKAFREVDNDFDQIVTQPKVGYMWRQFTIS